MLRKCIYIDFTSIKHQKRQQSQSLVNDNQGYDTEMIHQWALWLAPSDGTGPELLKNFVWIIRSTYRAGTYSERNSKTKFVFTIHVFSSQNAQKFVKAKSMFES